MDKNFKLIKTTFLNKKDIKNTTDLLKNSKINILQGKICPYCKNKTQYVVEELMKTA